MAIDHTKNWWLIYYDWSFDNTMNVFRITGPHDLDYAIEAENNYDGIGYATAHYQEGINE